MKEFTQEVVTLLKTSEGEEKVTEEVIIERPYRVYLNEEPIGSALILPADLEEFGAGYLFGLGYISKPEEIKEIRLCTEKESIFVYTTFQEIPKREIITTTGCGGTGGLSYEMLQEDPPPLFSYTISFSEIIKLAEEVLKGPRLPGVHTCGLWHEGRLRLLYLDIGQHHALDKLIGAILLGKGPRSGAIYTTGRLTVEMVAKCIRAGMPILISRSGTSSLGLELAQKAGLTLVCYARGEKINIFHAPQRIKESSS